ATTTLEEGALLSETATVSLEVAETVVEPPLWVMTRAGAPAVGRRVTSTTLPATLAYWAAEAASSTSTWMVTACSVGTAAAAVTVACWGTFQVAGVNVRAAGATERRAGSVLVRPTTMLAEGCVARATVK